MMNKALLLIVAINLLILVESIKEDDLITNLPGTNFKVNFKQYSGYLNAGNKGKFKFFYWLTESQTGNSENDPLIIWFQGGPGCSAVGGMFEELGPFYINNDGYTLYENIFSWNKYANLLAIESPVGVGFSYNTDDPKNNYTVGDDLSAELNLNSLIDFFNNVQPKYKNRRWYIAGESYAGIYIPSLTKLVLESIKNNNFPNKNFGGIAIGNGYMNIKKLTNALVLYMNYHGMLGVREWKNLKNECCDNPDPENCDFASHINYVYMNSSKDNCGDKVLNYLNLSDNIDAYNIYQDCYKSNYLTNTRSIIHKGLETGQFVKNANQINYDSTDNQFVYPCYNGYAAKVYLNRPDVQKAFHVDNDWIKKNVTWVGCNDPLYDNYPVKYSDTTDLFNEIIQIATDPKEYVKDFHILIYNGDVDTVCNYLGDAWHIDNIANINKFSVNNRYPWIFRNQIAGYIQTYYLPYNKSSSNMTIDVLTVKGSGHFVPNDRQGPSLQMINNFLKHTKNYNSTNGFNATPAPQPEISLPNDHSSDSPEVTTTTSEVTTSKASIFNLNCLIILIQTLIILYLQL